jgi:hypothetical protein
MARYAGRKGLVYIGTSGGGVAAAVISLNSWSLNRATDKIEVTSFLDSNKTYVQGLPDLRGSFAGFWDDTETKLFTAAASSAAVNMYLYPSQDALTKYGYGLAWLDASLDCSVSDAVKVSSDFVAGGSWDVTRL